MTAANTSATYPVGDGLTEDCYDAILSALSTDAVNHKALKQIIADLHPADITELLERLSPEKRAVIAPLIPNDKLAKTLHGLHGDIQESLIADIPEQELATALDHVESDDKTDLAQHLSEYRNLAADDHLLVYPEDTAGGLMQVELLALPKTWTVGDVLGYIRDHNSDLPAYLHRVFVVGRNMRHVGSVSLSRLVRQPLSTKLQDLIKKQNITILDTSADKEVVRLFQKYDLLSAAVIDDTGALLGVITADDVLNATLDNQEADALRAAGVDEESDLFAPLTTTAKQRFPWLFINLLTAILASLVIAQFDGKIAEIVALAVLMPIVASMGGNAGTQTMTVTIRALATNHITAQNALSILYKELLTGGFNGLLLALLLALGTTLIYQDSLLGLVICMATILNHLLAALAGMLIPLSLEKMGKDPAISSGVLLTTVTDVGGFLSFLGLAALLL